MSVVEGLVDMHVVEVSVDDVVGVVDVALFSMKPGSVEVVSRLDVKDVESFDDLVP